MLEDIDRRTAGTVAASARPRRHTGLATPRRELPLRSWSSAVKERVVRAVLGAVDQWHEAWGVAPRERLPVVGTEADPRALVQSAFDVTAADLSLGSPSWRSAGSGLWWAFSPAATPPVRWPVDGEKAPHLSTLCRALFGEPSSARGPGNGSELVPSESAAEEVARAAWEDWSRRVRVVMGGSEASDMGGGAEPAGVWWPWSGSLLVTLPWVDGSVRLLIAAERVERFRSDPSAPSSVERRASVAPVGRALAARTVRLQMEMEPFEVQVGALAALKVGDVLQTVHRLDAPLIVTMDDGEGRRGDAVCAAFLGRAGEQGAVELRRARTVRRPGQDAPSSQKKSERVVNLQPNAEHRK